MMGPAIASSSGGRRFAIRKRPRGEMMLTMSSSKSNKKQNKQVASSICLLAGLALMASTLSVNTPERRLSSATGTNVIANKVRHVQHGSYLGRHTRRLEEEQDVSTTTTDESLSPTATTGTKPRKRVALVRPFAPFSAHEIMNSFGSWDTYWPCTSLPLHPYDQQSMLGGREDGSVDYDVDLYLSFSQTYNEENPDFSFQVKKELKNKFTNNGGWNGCFSKLYNIEAGIPPEMDQYERNHIQTNRNWVNGPNTQFRSLMNTILQRNDAMAAKATAAGQEYAPYYEAVVILEGDAHVQTVGWLDAILDEMSTKAPFAVLGSTYRGHSWDNFRDSLPKSLLEHINGNAVYNVTHPLTLHYVEELKEEKKTYFNSIPYDYRMSQMIVEGRDGTPPEFPFPEMTDEDTGMDSVILPPKKEKFQGWWQKWGGEGDANPIKESSVISNWAATNYLPEHVNDGSPIVHGKGAWRPYDSSHHKITLVVSDWDEHFAETLLSTIDSSIHPFSEILVMKSPSTTPESHSLWHTVWNLWHPKISAKIPITYVERDSPDFMDVCDAPVDGEWFMVTNSYHKVADSVDLMFSHDDPPRPLIPFTPASSKHCKDYPACEETCTLAREIYPALDKVILDMDMVYHTSSRNAFCHEWKKVNGDRGEVLLERLGGAEAYLRFMTSGIPRGPTATSYLAYLEAAGMADNIYAFTNRLDHGAKDHFRKIHPQEEMDRHLATLGQPKQRATRDPVRELDSKVDAKDEDVTALQEAMLQVNDGSFRRMNVNTNHRFLQSARDGHGDESGFFAKLWQGFLNFFRRLFLIKTEPEEPHEPVVDVTVTPQPGTIGSTEETAPITVNRAKTGISYAGRGRNKVKKKDDNAYGGGEIMRGLMLEKPGWLVQKERSRADATYAAEEARKKVKKNRRVERRARALNWIL